jgi:hypothetical protein
MNIRRGMNAGIGAGFLAVWAISSASAQTIPYYDTDGQLRDCLSAAPSYPEPSLVSIYQSLCGGVHTGELQTRDFLKSHWNEYNQSQRLWCIALVVIKNYGSLKYCIEHWRMDLPPEQQPR